MMKTIHEISSNFPLPRNMKKLVLCLFLLGGILNANAQSSERKWNMGVMFGINVYAGDLGNSTTNFTSDVFRQNPSVGLTFSRYINRSFDVSLNGSFGSWGYYKDDITIFKGNMLHGNLNLKYKFNNGYLLSETSKIAPYAFVGGGATKFTGSRINSGYDYPVVAGLGASLYISNALSIFYQGTFGYMGTAHNNPQTNNGIAATGNDQFMLHMVGVGMSLGRGRDADKDGINDKKDKCPNTPLKTVVDEDGCPLDKDGDGVEDSKDKCPDLFGLASTNGCPDSDKDGIADIEDQCPNEAGTFELNGCPDADEDGIIDSKDKCPNIFGILAMNGCPDKDNDGVTDADDLCPDLPGTSQTQGCPDSDKDGIHDGIDKCPNSPGTSEHFGCPDTDKDGIFDDLDRCINLVGVPENQGCPEIKKETKQLFEKALQGIQFETGKAKIKSVSFPILNAIVKVMKENPTYVLFIGGHTDNIGEDEMNMTLSQDRATEVSKYLITHGVDPLRVNAKGYGETSPVDTNDSVNGRTRNRRVEFKVEFLQ
ncbi:MAG: OmpA family protein [Bacteroidia bacterium]|nr:OmpA family protein [Bacteroidia bacterium]MCF8426624.1 OmpA family protein [Bacteroidia bacterium]MCF8446928.1 OmpA family protein [Bacteroidia bacterium]